MFSGMSIFEIGMLLCFGAAWPFSIYRSLKSGSIAGKSPFFLGIIIVGYLCGILNKVFYRYDQVVFLYALNLLMVSTDLIIYMRNAKRLRGSAAK
jgi:hypothetical protein